MSLPMLRSDIKKTPGRLIFKGVDMYSKLGTSIERTLVHEVFNVGTDAHGELDYRDKEFYARVRITPDGRFDSTLAAVLWPYGNYVAGQKLFLSSGDNPTPPQVEFPLEIDGTDASIEKFASAALETMPPMKFTATETIVGSAEFLCLRTENGLWGVTDSLVHQGDGGGTINSGVPGSQYPMFQPSQILTGPYLAQWTPGLNGLTIPVFDTLDGFTVEFNISYSDESRELVGLYNRRIKAISCRVRCSPIGVARQSIVQAEFLQNPGAIRGRSIQQNSGDFTICQTTPGSPGDVGPIMFRLKNAALTEDKQTWSSETVRETDLVWQATRTFSTVDGSVGPLFSVLA